MRRNVFRSLSRPRLARAAALPLLAGLGLIVAGCSTPPPAFTVYGGRGSVQVPPSQYCDITGLHCPPAGSAAVLTVPDGQLVQISAPESVAKVPWQVAAEYKNPASGDSYVGCSQTFPAGQQYAYTVRPPAGDQLVLVEIYEFSTTIVAMPNGDFSFQTRGTWVVSNNANGAPIFPKAADNLCADEGQ